MSLQRFSLDHDREKKEIVPQRIWFFLLIFFCVIYSRLVLLGNYPFMDEGYYVYEAMRIHQSLTAGLGLPKNGTLQLYPLLLSWLCILPGNSFLWFRLADLIFAIWGAYLYCRLVFLFTSSRIVGFTISFIVLCSLNIEPVIQSGFKNSITAAYVPLFYALIIVFRKPCEHNSSTWYLVGVLTASGVLLREPLAIFSILGFVAIWKGWGKASALRYAIGGCAAGIVVFALDGVARGNIFAPLLSYILAADVYCEQVTMVKIKFFEALHKFVQHYNEVILLFLISLFIFLRNYIKIKNHDWGKNTFWLCASLLPIIEPLTKVGFLYHFAVCIPGMGIFCAINLPQLIQQKHVYARKFLYMFLIYAVCFATIILPTPTGLVSSLHEVLLNKMSWEEKFNSEKSSTIMVANCIKQILPANGTLSISGFTYFLYGIVKALPPANGYFASDDNYKLSDLSRTFRALGKDPARMANALRKNPPDVVAVASAILEHEPDYHDELKKSIKLSGIYEQYIKIEPDMNKNYGWLGYDIFKLKSL